MIETGRWRAALAAALVCVAVGVVAGNSAIFLSSIVGFCYVAYGSITRPPDATLAVERTLSPASPAPGDRIDVTLTVRNETDRPVVDVGVIDDPPDRLPVVEGTPRSTLTLQSGERATLEYAVRARRGEYEFGDATLVVRNVSGAVERRERISLAESFDCDDVLERLPLASQTIQHAGRVETEVGGEGLEFYSTREHHPEDPMSRIDWKRYASTGELTTVEFREERAASVVVAVDVREENAVVRDPSELDGVELSERAAGWIVGALLSGNNRVGLALYGGRGHYLTPRTGREQAARARALLAGEWRRSFGRANQLSWGNDDVGQFCRHLADEKQVVFVTPVLDEEPVESARRFRAYGHEVTVVAPGVAAADSVGGTVERIDHERRLGELREHGVRVVEWAPDESLHVAVDRARRRWSA